MFNLRRGGGGGGGGNSIEITTIKSPAFAWVESNKNDTRDTKSGGKVWVAGKAEPVLLG